MCKPTAARADSPHPLPSYSPPQPLPPTSREPQEKRKEGGKHAPRGCNRRETPRGKTNLGPGLREKRGAGNCGPADASSFSTSPGTTPDPRPARAPGPPSPGQGWPPLLPSAPGPATRPTGSWAKERRGYLSGVGFGLWRLEEGVRQLPEPHGHGLGNVGRLGVHDGVEKRLQVGLRVPSDVHDLVSGRGGRRRRLGPWGCRLPRSGRRALPLWGLRGRLPLALGGWLRRRLLPGIHGFCLPRRAPGPGGRGLRPRSPARRAQTREAMRAAGRAALDRGSNALFSLRAGGLRGGPASPAPAPPPPPCAPAPLVWRLRLGRGCEEPGPGAPENFFPSLPRRTPDS